MSLGGGGVGGMGVGGGGWGGLKYPLPPYEMFGQAHVWIVMDNC